MTIGNVDDFSPYINGVKIEEGKKLSDYPKLLETKEIVFKRDDVIPSLLLQDLLFSWPLPFDTYIDNYL